MKPLLSKLFKTATSALLLVVLVLLAGCTVLNPLPGFQLGEPQTTEIPNDTPAPVAVVCIEGLQWDDITPEHTPTLYSLVETGGVANLANNGSALNSLTGASSPTTLHQMQIGNTPTPAGRTQELSTIDLEVSLLLEANSRGDASGGASGIGNSADDTSADNASDDNTSDDTGDTRLVVVASPAFVRESDDKTLTPAIIANTGLNGYLSTPTTHRIGLVAGTDISNYINSTQVPSSTGISATQAPSSASVGATQAPSAQERIAFLEHNAKISNIIDVTKETMDLAFLTLFIVVVVLSVALLFLEIEMNPRHTRWLVPLTRALLLITLAYPVSTFLMFVIPPPLYTLTDTNLGLVLLCLLWTALLVAIALVIGRKTHWIHSLLFLFVVTFGVILADQLMAGPLTLTGFLSYQASDGVRFYGLGNEAAALLFGSWTTFSGVVVNRFPKARLTPHFKRWIFPLVSAAIIMVCVAPQTGASFGVLVWGIPGSFITWWLFAERPLRPHFVAIVVVAAALLAVGVLMLDLAFSPLPHLGNLDGYVQDGPVALLLGVFAEIAAYSWATVVYSPPLTLLFVVVVAWLVVLAAVKPGSYKEFWRRNRGFRAAFTAGLAIMIMMCFIEDSGIFMPALYLAYLLAGFIWLVCDMHTWRSRVVASSGEHVTLRELMRLALAQEAPASASGTSVIRDVEKDGEAGRQ